MNSKIKIGNKWIGKGYPVFIIAEAGVNHNGDLSLAKKLIDLAKGSGADAVKFQTFKAEEIVTPRIGKASYQKNITSPQESQYEMLKRLELKDSDFKTLAAYANKKNIIFLSSPFDKKSVDLLEEIGVSAFKIASGEITNLPLLEYIAKKDKPIILSTGMASLDEIKQALQVINTAGKQEVILLHCVTSYPVKIEEVNLKAIITLGKKFNLLVGFSDHTEGIIAPAAAVVLGACIIEKHFTLDKNLPGPDHSASLGPEELKSLVRAVRDTEKALGNGLKQPTAAEEAIKIYARKSIVAKVDIPRGVYIKEDMLSIKRAGKGIEPKYLKDIVGKIIKRSIKKDQPLFMELIRKQK
jgi:N-acetylneuraminate synthase/N,N'-diacetyllegionaminate synthase